MEERILKKTIQMEANHDKERRKNNLVIYNIEDKNTNLKRQAEEDRALYRDLFINELQLEEIEIVETVRLGKRKQQKVTRTNQDQI